MSSSSDGDRRSRPLKLGTANAQAAKVAAEGDKAKATSPMRGLRAPSTEAIAPVDVALSRFMTRHGPLEIANRLLSQYDRPAGAGGPASSSASSASAAAVGGSRRRGKKEPLIESVVWQSATGSEYELAKIPKAAAQAIRQSVSCPTTSELLWPAAHDGEAVEQDDGTDGGHTASSASAASSAGTNDGTSGGAFEDAKVVVVPFHGGNPGGLNSGVNASQAFYQHLMDAVQLGLQRVESISYEMTSTKRKRRLKMNKHKFKKRRKEQESLRKKLG